MRSVQAVRVVRRLVVAALVVAVGAGCATVAHQDYIRSGALGKINEGRPRIRVDRVASALSLRYDDSQAYRYDRDELLRAIEEMWNASATRGEVVAARVSIRGSIRDQRGWLWSIAGGYLFPAWVFVGGPSYSASSHVDVEVGLDTGAVFAATGDGQCYAGLWYPGDPSACAFDKAIVNAIRRGLADAQ